METSVGLLYFQGQLTQLKDRLNANKKLLSPKGSTFKIRDYIQGCPCFIDPHISVQMITSKCIS